MADCNHDCSNCSQSDCGERKIEKLKPHQLVNAWKRKIMELLALMHISEIFFTFFLFRSKLPYINLHFSLLNT